MSRAADVIRGWLGWCPHATRQKTRTFTVPVPESGILAAALPEPATQPAASAPGSPGHTSIQENYVLILLLLAGLFCLVDFRMLALASVFSAILVYYDAGMLHAGEKFERESILGEVATWRPLTWAASVLIVPLIFLAIYTFSRQEIFEANNG